MKNHRVYLKLVSILFSVRIRQHRNAQLRAQKQLLIKQQVLTKILSLDVHPDITVYYVILYHKRIVGCHLCAICKTRMLQLGHVLLRWKVVIVIGIY